MLSNKIFRSLRRIIPMLGRWSATFISPNKNGDRVRRNSNAFSSSPQRPTTPIHSLLSATFGFRHCTHRIETSKRKRGIKIVPSQCSSKCYAQTLVTSTLPMALGVYWRTRDTSERLGTFSRRFVSLFLVPLLLRFWMDWSSTESCRVNDFSRNEKHLCVQCFLDWLMQLLVDWLVYKLVVYLLIIILEID